MSLEADETERAGSGEPLTVIVVNDFATVSGGTDAVAIAEARGLAQRGHRVTLLTGHGEPDRELVEAGVAVRGTLQQTTLGDPNRLRAAARGIWNQAAASVVRELARDADRNDAVVHVHGFTKVLSASVIRAAVRAGLPTIASMHDYFVACPNGAFFNYRTERVCPLTPLSARCIATDCDARNYSHKLWRVARSSVQRRFGEMPSGVRDFIAPSQAAASIVRPFLPGDVRVHVVPSPVSVGRAAPAAVADNSRFVFVGRLQRDKGPVIFAQAAREANVPAVFVGSGDQAEAIRGANPDAELAGWIAPGEVESMLRRARAVVNPSLIYETQGLWFRSGDVDDLAERLALLARDSRLAARLGAAAYERFWSGNWDSASHLDRLERIFRVALRG
jgi:glycosyltransferase involved in cell wall biosynthesis